MLLQINKKSIFFYIIIFLLIMGELLITTGFSSPFDEMVGIISFLYIIKVFVANKLSKEDFVSVTILIFVILIGLLSNLVSGLNSSISSICLDIVAETKVLWTFFAVKYFVTKNFQEKFARDFIGITKAFLIIAFICGIVSQFIDIGMVTSKRYGISGYTFIFYMTFQFFAVIMLCMTCLSLNDKLKGRNIYYLMGLTCVFLTTKGPAIIFVILFLFLYRYFKYNKTIKLKIMLILFVIITMLGTYQIESYLLNQDAPRFLLLFYSQVTANEYFPLGSGFATFASEQAARLYSALYYLYGFDSLYGMKPEDNGRFLKDTFWAMAIGQFGWIGGCLYIYVYIRIFISINNNLRLNAARKAFACAGLIQSLIHAVGAAILSSEAGVIMYLAIAMVLNRNNKE